MLIAQVVLATVVAFVPKTVTVEPLGMTVNPRSAEVPFLPRVVTVQPLGVAMQPAQPAAFMPRSVTVQPLGTAGAPRTGGVQ